MIYVLLLHRYSCLTPPPKKKNQIVILTHIRHKNKINFYRTLAEPRGKHYQGMIAMYYTAKCKIFLKMQVGQERTCTYTITQEAYSKLDIGNTKFEDSISKVTLSYGYQIRETLITYKQNTFVHVLDNNLMFNL